MKFVFTSFLTYPVESKVGPVRIPRRAPPVTRAARLEQSALAAGKFAGSCPNTLA